MRAARVSWVLLCPVLLIAQSALWAFEDKKPPDKPARYETREDHDPEGIGKFYMGREIAQVMGHLAADWLERPEREREEQPNKLLDALKLKEDDGVADIGAGSGYLTFRIARRLGKGKVLAVDIQPEMLDLMRAAAKAAADAPSLRPDRRTNDYMHSRRSPERRFVIWRFLS